MLITMGLWAPVPVRSIWTEMVDPLTALPSSIVMSPGADDRTAAGVLGALREVPPGVAAVARALEHHGHIDIHLRAERIVGLEGGVDAAAVGDASRGKGERCVPPAV